MNVVVQVVPTIVTFGFTSLISYLAKNGKLNNKKYDEEVEKLKKEYISYLKKDLKQVKTHFISNFITSSEQIKNLDTISETVLIQENFQSNIFKNLKDNMGKYTFTSNINNFNILILGKTGVGKSTLINTILQLKGENEIPTSSITGDSVTKGEPKAYESNKMKGIRFYDSEGISLSNEISKCTEIITKFINEKLSTNNPDLFINCIWYCVNGERFEERELEFIKSLMEIYTDENLPIIIVYTKAVDDKVDDVMIDKIKKRFNNIGLNITILKCLAKDKEIIHFDKKYYFKAFGINELITETFTRLQFAINSSCFHAVRTQLKKKFLYNLNCNCEELRNLYLEDICNFKELPVINLSNLIFIAQKLIYNNKNFISQDSKVEMKYFIDRLYSYCYISFKQFFCDYINQTCSRLAMGYQEVKENNKNFTDTLVIISEEMAGLFKSNNQIANSELMKSKDDISSGIGTILENLISTDLNKVMNNLFIDSFQRVLEKNFVFILENIKKEELNMRIAQEIQLRSVDLLKSINYNSSSLINLNFPIFK